MKCWILFSRKNKRNITNLSSAEPAHSVVSIKNTVFDLITAHTPISAQSSDFVVLRLQAVYFLSTSL